MFKKIPTPNPDILAFEVIGNISKEDYVDTLIPIIHKTITLDEKLKILFNFGDDFRGFSASAIWEDIKLGIHHMSAFDRIAIVSDSDWILKIASIAGSLIPCTVNSFKCREFSDAMAWLNSGEIGLDHSLDEKNGVLIVEISSALSSDSFNILGQAVDEWISKGGDLKGLVIHSKKFPFWEDLGSLFSHFEFIKNYHEKIKKVALCTDVVILEYMPSIANHFVDAQIKHFSFNKLSEAKRWVEKD